ncbi:DUF1972 domain-containing protein [Oceanimonas sp. CHS3-5]|uniref:DUF1972 domain-containing protein n=1 Tax=Oceanimonas sp. CHS3-5 TaxID=3068186 RepID=UPI00273F67C2|nr:DUF1972 domain-containing protein [Oceanimonas sp. CHS3-5]MDP5292524.1 DUF1972 domain-containing protein [Oceanimonas sp. CHS3-5]
MLFRHLNILGIRGIPAAHGGFETFAERLALYLVQQGWQVTVYCQEQDRGLVYESKWQGVRLVHIPVVGDGALSTMAFDWKAARHASKQQGLCLTLGYNTALFNIWQRLAGQHNLFNMDGLEWQRDKWIGPARAWLWLNERAGCWLGSHLIADHPRIKAHLVTRVNERNITMIPYGADELTKVDASPLHGLGLEAGEFSVIIARPEPENSILELVRAFSTARRHHKLVVLGRYDERNEYHRSVKAAASNEVLFAGAVYDADIVGALRCYCRLYLHGHTVGGTNPSLVEALGAGSAVLAHNNKFNRWVAGDGAVYFDSVNDCERSFEHLLADDAAIAQLQAASRKRFRACFTWSKVLAEYEALLTRWLPDE